LSVAERLSARSSGRLFELGFIGQSDHRAPVARYLCLIGVNAWRIFVAAVKTETQM